MTNGRMEGSILCPLTPLTHSATLCQRAPLLSAVTARTSHLPHKSIQLKKEGGGRNTCAPQYARQTGRASGGKASIGRRTELQLISPFQEEDESSLQELRTDGRTDGLAETGGTRETDDAAASRSRSLARSSKRSD